MSRDKIEVSMNVYDIPIVIEALEKAEDEIMKLQQENQQLKKQKDDAVKLLYKVYTFDELETIGLKIKVGEIDNE